MTISFENRKFFPSLCILRPQLNGFPLEFDTGAGGQKTRMMGLPGRVDDVFSCLDTTHERDGRTDGHRATANALSHIVAR